MMENSNVFEQLKLAYDYRAKERFDLALEEFNRLVQDNPGNEAILLDLGKTYKMMRRLPEAIAEFIKIVRINPENREAVWELGETSRMSNNCQAALKELTEIATRFPFNDQAHIELSRIYLQLLDYDNAFKELDKALMISKSNSEVYLCLGQLHRAKGEKEKAILNFKQAILLNPDQQNAHMELANIYEERKNYISAAQEIEEAKNIGGLDLHSRLRLVRLYYLQNASEQLERETQGILKLNPGDTLFQDNILNEIEIMQKRTIIKSKVKRLWVTLTSRCNIKCRTCGLWSSPWDIPRKTVDEILQLYPYLERLVWLGGEVFLCEYFDEMFEKAKAFPKLEQQVITNGVILTKSWIERIMRANAELTISIDGTTREVYEYIRRGASFEKLISNIKFANEAKLKYCSRTPMRLNAVIMKSNYHQLEDFLEFARDYGFCQVSLMALHFDEDPEENILYSHVDKKALQYITEAIPRMREKAKLYNIDLDILLPTLESAPRKSDAKNTITFSSQQDKLYCKMPWKYMFICDKGTVYLTGSCAMPIGNIYRNSLDEIWNSPEARLYRENMLQNDFADICRPECRTRWEI